MSKKTRAWTEDDENLAVEVADFINRSKTLGKARSEQRAREALTPHWSVHQVPITATRLYRTAAAMSALFDMDPRPPLPLPEHDRRTVDGVVMTMRHLKDDDVHWRTPDSAGVTHHLDWRRLKHP